MVENQEQQGVDLSTFYRNPEGAATVCGLIEKNEDNQFELALTEREQLSHDTIKFTFAFPNKDWIIGMPVSHHLKIFNEPVGDEDMFCKPYTPVTPINHKGSIQFVIKCYPKTEEFPNGGKMGNFLKTRQVGDRFKFEGPIGMVSYLGDGTFKHIRKGERKVTKIGLIAGGSGITPMYSIMQAIHLAKETHLDVKFLYSNKTRDDVLLKPELDAIANDASCTNISIAHTITRENDQELPAGYRKGRVTIEMLRELGFPEPGDDCVIAMCGPKGMNDATKALLLANGYTEQMVYP